MLEVLIRLVKILNSEHDPSGLAAGISAALCFALLPAFSMAKWLIILIVVLFKINISAFLFGSLIFSLLSVLIAHPIHLLGEWLILAPTLAPLWSSLGDEGVTAWLALNNTLGLGSLVVSMLALVPMFWLSKRAVTAYRKVLKPKLEQLPIIKMLKTSRLVQLYHEHM